MSWRWFEIVEWSMPNRSSNSWVVDHESSSTATFSFSSLITVGLPERSSSSSFSLLALNFSANYSIVRMIVLHFCMWTTIMHVFRLQKYHSQNSRVGSVLYGCDQRNPLPNLLKWTKIVDLYIYRCVKEYAISQYISDIYINTYFKKYGQLLQPHHFWNTQ